MSEETYYVYVDTMGDTRVPFYVGYGNEYRIRYDHRNKWHDRIAAKHGMTRCVMCTVDDVDDARAIEIAMIAELHTFVDDPEYNGMGCNLTPGGEGHTPCRAERKRRSKFALERWGDSEKRQAWTDALQGIHTGIVYSPEKGAAHSEKMKGENNPNWGGKSVTEETRRLMSKTRKGKPTWLKKGDKQPERLYAWRFKYVIVVDTKENIHEFRSQKDAADFLAKKLKMSPYTMRGYLTRRDTEIRKYKIVYSDDESKT